jgi:hypothetical protein
MTITKRNARQLMNRGYEMRAQVLNGLLTRQDEVGWTIDSRPLDELLQTMEGQQVVIIAADIGRGDGERRVCTVCGTEYEGSECPRCSRARRRLRR